MLSTLWKPGATGPGGRWFAPRVADTLFNDPAGFSSQLPDLGSRYDTVIRNNSPVMAFRQRKTLSVTL